MRQVPALPVVGSFAERIISGDLPALTAPRRKEVIAFVAHRVDTLPSFTRFGVLILGSIFRGLLALPGGWGVAKVLIKLPLPLVAEYPRLVRSLGYAYIWEHWPSTTPTGAESKPVVAVDVVDVDVVDVDVVDVDVVDVDVAS